MGNDDLPQPLCHHVAMMVGRFCIDEVSRRACLFLRRYYVVTAVLVEYRSTSERHGKPVLGHM